jgi:peptidoglycan/LPS O-acetylase OafA/YrhL
VEIVAPAPDSLGGIQTSMPVEADDAGLNSLSQTKKAPVKRNQSLDVLRCIAILLVLGRHVDRYWLWNRIGWIGVDLFFVLSGFLVSGLLFQEFKDTGSINVRRFILRRGLKIWPAFYVYIGVTAILAALIQADRSAPFPVRTFAITSLFLSNYFHNNARFFDHIWSLAIEEHFYLVLPLVLLVLAISGREKKPFSRIPFIFVLASFSCLAMRIFSKPLGAQFWTTHTRLDSLFAGVTLSYLYHFRPKWFSKLTGEYAPGIALLCCLPAVFFEADSRSMQTIGLSVLYVGFGFLLAWSLVRTPKTAIGIFVARVAAGIGFYSYSIYLWHRLFAFVFSTHPSTLAFWAYVALAIGMGIAMSKLVEMPALRLREKWQLTA